MKVFISDPQIAAGCSIRSILENEGFDLSKPVHEEISPATPWGRTFYQDDKYKKLWKKMME